jgi:type I restriction enzyme S subunit
MNDWKRAPIETVYLNLFDGPHATPKPATGGPIFLGIKNISEDGRLDLSEIRHIAEEDFSEWTRRVTPQAGDIVFTYEATLNRYAIIPQGFRGCLGRRLALIRPNPKKVDTQFLFYYFFGDDWRTTISRNMLSGSTVDRIPLTSFPTFKISLPPLPTQRKIAAILSAYDDLIKNNTRRIAILEEMAQSLYREWFVHFRFPGHDENRMVESALGMIPKGWEVVKLGDRCAIVMGQSPSSEFYNSNGEGLPFHQGVSDFGERFPVDRMYCTATNRVAETGDVLFSVRAPVGRINLAGKKIIIGRGLSAIRSRAGNQSFVYQQLKEQFQEEDTIGNGAIFKSVTKEDMYSIKMLQPPADVVLLFERLVQPIFSNLGVLIQKNANLRQTRDLLLPKLISSEIDVEGLAIVGVEEMGEMETQAVEV